MKLKKILSPILAASLLLGSLSLTGCGAGAGSDTSFTWWIYSGADASYYTSYEENPAVQYTLNKTWGEEDKTIELEFWQPVSGQEGNNYSTMLASGDLPDIIDAVICDAPYVMYENGYALEITDYVKQYMPNYMALLESNEVVKKNAVYVDENGDEHYYGLISINDDYESMWQGYMYRRDWIVKYGKNPETGAAFTGGYTDSNDPDSWEDDVVFPSGETTPYTISDWEWMFEIFEKAYADLGIEDSYCISMYYPGFTWAGGLTSCFGGGTNYWYEDENGKVQFGADQEAFRTYLECMNTWYEKGWLDKNFNTRTSDAFYDIDSTAVRSGEVGMWCGSQSQLGGRMDLNDGGYTEGIYVAASAYPVNDKYGDESTWYTIPNCVMGTNLATSGIIITTAAEDKDIATLCSYLDYFYSEEGSLVRTLGLTADQAFESGSTIYDDYGISDGAYFVNENGLYEKADAIVNNSGNLLPAISFAKAPGLNIVSKIDNGLSQNYQENLDLWVKYKNTGVFQGTITTSMMSTEDSKEATDLFAKMLDYMNTNASDFITGKKDITKDSSDWKTWCKTLQKYNYQNITDMFQTYVDKYPFR